MPGVACGCRLINECRQIASIRVRQDVEFGLSDSNDVPFSNYGGFDSFAVQPRAVARPQVLDHELIVVTA